MTFSLVGGVPDVWYKATPLFFFGIHFWPTSAWPQLLSLMSSGSFGTLHGHGDVRSNDAFRSWKTCAEVLDLQSMHRMPEIPECSRRSTPTSKKQHVHEALLDGEVFDGRSVPSLPCAGPSNSKPNRGTR